MIVIGVIASHIEHHKRLLNFEKLFQSILDQTKLPTVLFVSISCEASLLDAVKKFILLSKEKSRKHSLDVCFFLREDKRSQFEHYASLLQQLKQHSEGWVLFSDDDDLWHTHRVQLYSSMEPPAFVNCIRSNTYLNDGKIEVSDSLGNYVEYMPR